MPLISWGLAALQARRYTTFSYIVIDLHIMVADVANAYDAILTRYKQAVNLRART